ncbi:MAG: hypothetical protein CL693_17790 [Cellvibrionaceae bacterium]|nr:hypothetical protein [Cellvibrionaceae bacterium]
MEFSALVRVTIFALALMAQGSLSAEQNTIRYIDTEKLRPLSYSKNGQVVGMFPEMAQLILESPNRKIVSRLVPEARLLFEIQGQLSDATMIYAFRDLSIEDYPEFVEVCPTPTVTLSIDVIWMADNNLNIQTYSDLAPYRVGIFNSSPAQIDSIGLDFPHLSRHQSSEALVKSLISNRIDIAIMNWDYALILAKNLVSTDRLKRGENLGNMDIHLAIAKHWGTALEREKICNRVIRLKQAGEFTRIKNKFFVP